MEGSRSASVTFLLQEWQRGNESALGQVAELVQSELRRLAASYLRRERPGHILQPTGLVNEAFVRLMGQENLDWESRSHFVAIAAQHMRQILVDYARRQKASKRGGGATLVSLEDDAAAANPRSVDLLALDEALEKLQALDARTTRALELKFFGGLEMTEIAAVLGVSLKTVERDVRLGRAWLRKALSS